MRVIAHGDDGRKNLDILRVLATTPQSLISTNHTLPMIREVQLGQITFGVFPLVGYTLHTTWDDDNSVGDILDMLIQALEVGSFHETNKRILTFFLIRASNSSIAHRVSWPNHQTDGIVL